MNKFILALLITISLFFCCNNFCMADDYRVYLKQAIAYYEKKDIDSALKSLDKAMELKKDDYKLYEFKGYLLKLSRKYAESIEQFNKAVELDPKNETIYSAIAESYCSLGNYDAAISVIEGHNKNKKPKANDLYYIGYLYIKTNDYEKALNYLSQSVEINPEFEEKLHLLKEVKILVEKEKKREHILAIKPQILAPEKLHKLVKTKKSDNYLKPTVYEVLDLIWNDPEGQILANIIMKKKIKIKVWEMSKEATGANTEQITYNSYLGSITPLGMSHHNVVVNYGKNYAESFNTDDPDKKLRSIIVMIHEFCHAVSPEDNDSKQEELIANMVGMNIAHRIFLDRDFTKDEAEYYAKYSAYCINTSDFHKNLKKYNDFDKHIKKLGIKLPYYDSYKYVLYSESDWNEDKSQTIFKFD